MCDGTLLLHDTWHLKQASMQLGAFARVAVCVTPGSSLQMHDYPCLMHSIERMQDCDSGRSATDVRLALHMAGFWEVAVRTAYSTFVNLGPLRTEISTNLSEGRDPCSFVVQQTGPVDSFSYCHGVLESGAILLVRLPIPLVRGWDVQCAKRIFPR